MLIRLAYSRSCDRAAAAPSVARSDEGGPRQPIALAWQVSSEVGDRHGLTLLSGGVSLVWRGLALAATGRRAAARPTASLRASLAARALKPWRKFSSIAPSSVVLFRLMLHTPSADLRSWVIGDDHVGRSGLALVELNAWSGVTSCPGQGDGLHASRRTSVTSIALAAGRSSD